MPPKKKKLNKKALLRKQAEEKRLQEEAARKEQEEIRRKQEEEERIRREEEERIRVHENEIRDVENRELEALLKQLSATDYQRRVDVWENKRWNDYMFKTKEMDPLDLRQVNSFITHWNEDNDYLTENIFQKCHTCIQIIDEIFSAFHTYPYEDQKTRNVWQEGVENLKNVIAEKLEYSSFMLLKDADQYLDEKSFNMEFSSRDRRITMLLWVNLYTASKSRGMNPTFGFEFQLPPALVAEGCAVRVLQLAFEHVSIPKENGEPVNDPNETDTETSKDIQKEAMELQTQVPTESLKIEQANTTTEIEQSENADNENTPENDRNKITGKEENLPAKDVKGGDLNEEKPPVLDNTTIVNDGNETDKLNNETGNKIDDMNQEVEPKLDDKINESDNRENAVSNQIEKPENDINKEEDKQNQIAESGLPFEADNSIYNQVENNVTKVDPPKSEVKPIDMNEYFLVGGVTHFDYLQVPKLTVRHSGITYIYREKVGLIRMEYRKEVKNTNNEFEDSTDNTENNAANQKNEKMFLKIKLPDNVAWHETSTLARFCPKKNAFSAEGFSQVNYDINNNQISFQTEYFGIYGMLQRKYINFPYKGWQLCGGKGIQLTLDGQCFSLTIEVSEHGCRVSDLKPQRKLILEELVSTWRTTEQLIQKLLSVGINIAVEENDRTFIGLPVKNEALENNVYDSISLLAKNFDFSWSKWNNRTEMDEIVLQFKPFTQTNEIEYRLALTTPSRTLELKGGEEMDTFSREVMESREFSSTLFHSISKSFPDQNKPGTNLEDACCLWNVRSLLRRCRILSCS